MNDVLQPAEQALLDKAYNARGPIEEKFTREYLPGFAALSESARKKLPCRRDVAYGPHRDEVCDIFPAARPGAPLHLFLHGGYWRMLTKNESGFVAHALQPAGATVMVNTYSLCPGVHLDVIVRQCQAFIVWAWRNAGFFNADPSRLFISGHSAGGHLVGMMLGTDFAAEYGLPKDIIKGATAVSGLYDLRPLTRAYIREWLQLSPEQTQRNSPLQRPPVHNCPVILAVGSSEPEGFLSQTRAYRAMLEARGVPVTTVDLPGMDHFAAWNEIMNPQAPLTRAVLAQMGLGGQRSENRDQKAGAPAKRSPASRARRGT
jgi:arylformamidase